VRVLVTGGAGFIGSHVVERLLSERVEVSILDDLNDFYAPELKLQNLDCVRQAGPIHFHQADIRDAARMEEIIGAERPDAVIHLAARAGVRPSLAEPLLYEQTNVLGTLTLLEACRKHGTPRFVFASSSSIYGAANRVPFREDDPSNLPVSVYAATKIAGEKLCYTYSHLYGISVVCLRFFTVYGPRQRPDLAIRKFTETIDAGRPIPVFGDGSTGRDYTYIEDIVQGIRAALEYPCSFDVFNLGNSHPVKLLEMIATIENALGRKAAIEWLPEQPGDVPITYADISKARTSLGYEPRTTFAAGVEKFVAWRRELARQRAAT
jgi:UDP-glucuronate 4-epimerase